jgi:hypothetical protein
LAKSSASWVSLPAYFGMTQSLPPTMVSAGSLPAGRADLIDRLRGQPGYQDLVAQDRLEAEVLLRYLLSGCRKFAGSGAKCRRQPSAGIPVI